MILYNKTIVPAYINYILYFEDDWIIKHNESSHWFSNGLELLKSKKLHNGQIGQVLLDSRHGGWPFQFSGGDNNIIHYRYHEFGYFEFQQDQKIIVNGDYMLVSFRHL